eukprot:scaffold12205_cov156-Skeletonema_marinoi.AAC.1
MEAKRKRAPRMNEGLLSCVAYNSGPRFENRDRELEENSDLNGIRTNLSGLCVNDPAENMAQTK